VQSIRCADYTPHCGFTREKRRVFSHYISATANPVVVTRALQCISGNCPGLHWKGPLTCHDALCVNLSMALSDETSWRDDLTATRGDEAVIAALQAEGALLRSQHAALTARIAELERRLGLNSSKSFKPPGRAMG